MKEVLFLICLWVLDSYIEINSQAASFHHQVIAAYTDVNNIIRGKHQGPRVGPFTKKAVELAGTQAPRKSDDCIVDNFCACCLIINYGFTGFVATNVTINITIPTHQDPVLVMSVFGWIIIHQHLGYSFDWNLTWDEYKAGFGSINHNHWLGLEKVHLLTSSQPYRLRVEMQQWYSNLWYSAEYWSFKIGDELNDKYRLEVSEYSGDAGDSLQYEGEWNDNGGAGYYYHNGMKFSTNDQDNDLLIGFNCALTRGGGWWYNRCYMACLTCNSRTNGWWTLPSWYVVNSRMMIKPQ